MTSESESQVRLFSPFPTLPDVNIDGVLAIVLESNQKLTRMQYRIEQTGCNNLTFNESHIPVTQQMDNMYKYLKQEVNEAQIELNTLSEVTDLSSHQNRRLELLVKNAHWMTMNLTSEHDDSLALLQHLPLVPVSSSENQSKMPHAAHSPFSIFVILLKN